MEVLRFDELRFSLILHISPIPSVLGQTQRGNGCMFVIIFIAAESLHLPARTF